MNLHFFGWTLLIFGAAQVWRLVFRYLFTNVWPNASAATVLGG